MDSHHIDTLYTQLGGEGAVRALVDRFYDLMDTLPEAYLIRKLHPASLEGSRRKLFMFLTGWLGGPQHYIEQYGHPRMRARHLPDLPAREQFWQNILGLADHMRNRAD